MSTWKQRLNSLLFTLFGWAIEDSAKADAKAEKKKEEAKKE